MVVAPMGAIAMACMPKAAYLYLLICRPTECTLRLCGVVKRKIMVPDSEIRM